MFLLVKRTLSIPCYVLTWLGIFFFAPLCHAQYYSLGQDAASLHWKQIKTANFRIIYPSDFLKQAFRLGNTLESYIICKSNILSVSKSQRTPIILHTQDVTPNAFTLWAPRRMEFFTTPPQNTYAQDWLEQLALHEYRHYLQLEKINTGFTHSLNCLFGEQVTAAVLGAYIPMWWMEGDAVNTETVFSHSGRGRVPVFEMELRAQWLDGKRFNYNKAVFGSYKDYIPDQYILGYHLVSYGISKYGSNIWNHTLQNVACHPWQITPFNRGLKKITGKSKTRYYREAVGVMDSLWQQQNLHQKNTSCNVLTKPKPSFTNYKYAHFINDSTWIAERSGMDDIYRIVIFDSRGNEKVLVTPGLYSSGKVSVSSFAVESGLNKPGSTGTDNLTVQHGKIVWAELQQDIRWEHRNYPVLNVYNLQNGKKQRMVLRQRLFAPAIDPEGKRIIAVQVREDNTASLVIFCPDKRCIEKEYLVSDKDFYITPVWNADGKDIVFIKLTPAGKSLEMLHLADRSLKTLVAPGFQEISNPVCYQNYVFFDASWSGIQNIYAVDTLTLEVKQVTSAMYGAQYPDVNKGVLVYSNYTSNGFEIVSTPLQPENWVSLNQVKDVSVKLYQKTLEAENGILIPDSIKTFPLQEERYSKFTHLFNFHSWAPVYININDLTANTGVTLLSQNLLSTMFTTLGYDYRTNDGTGTYHAGISYQGWFPVLDLTFAYGDHKENGYPEGEKVGFRYWATELKPAIRLPLNLSCGKFYRQLEPKFQFNYMQLDMDKDSPLKFKNSNITTFDYAISYSSYYKMGLRDLLPRFGQTVLVNYRHNAFHANKGGIFAGEMFFYLPGIGRHHSLWGYAAYQEKNEKVYGFDDFIRYPRSFTDIDERTVGSFKVNYYFPLCYPDLSLGSIIYLKRLKMNFFYDYGYGKALGEHHFYRSYGTELTSDLHLLRFITPFNIGVRTTYQPLEKELYYELLFFINLSDL